MLIDKKYLIRPSMDDVMAHKESPTAIRLDATQNLLPSRNLEKLDMNSPKTLKHSGSKDT